MVCSGWERPGTTPSSAEGVVTGDYEEYITPQVREVAALIESFWPGKYNLRFEVPLKELFPEPENHGLLHIWKHGRADLVVNFEKTGKVVSLIECHGAHHWGEKQARNDRRKYMLARENNVSCLCIYNSVTGRISRKMIRNLFGNYFYRKFTDD
tara:strand:- start:8326 stop:8787 length:462 start_codon:yes stop_codon:yes gene_type:complete